MRVTQARWLAVCVSFIAGCGLIDREPPPARTGERGVLSFEGAAVGVGLDGEVAVSRPEWVSCGRGCLEVKSAALPAAGTTVTLEPPLAEVTAVVATETGLAVRLRGQMPGRAQMVVRVGGRAGLWDATEIDVVVPDAVVLDCGPSGETPRDGMMVGAELSCAAVVSGGGLALGRVVPSVEGGIEVAAADAGFFKIRGAAPGRAALALSAGPLRWRVPVDVIDESEVVDVRLLDGVTRQPMEDDFILLVGETRTLRARVGTHDGRSAMGLARRFSAEPPALLVDVPQPAEQGDVIGVRGVSHGIGAVRGDLGGRHWEMPIRVRDR